MWRESPLIDLLDHRFNLTTAQFVWEAMETSLELRQFYLFLSGDSIELFLSGDWSFWRSKVRLGFK